ncbi:MAG TPA: c-type cytochrome [Nocardioides sp.]|uniref:c-type cytochrome n=1 Tax=Nocardioides sp. TaxID=35761 RepID=UPI002F41E857
MSGRTRRSWVVRSLGLLAVIGAALWLTTTLRAGSAVAGAGTAYSPSRAGDTNLGQHVFLRDCAWCHGIQAQGTSRGPDLRSAGPAYVDFMLKTGRMPLLEPDATTEPHTQKYDAATIAALVQYVGEQLGSGEPLPQLSAGDITSGRTVFLASCAACHSSSGTGTILQDGTRVPQLYDTPSEQIAEAVRVGPGEMPPFGAKTLDDQELNDVVSYVQQLGPQQVEGGHPLDQYGPIAESLLAFLIPLPLLVIIILLLGRRAPRKESEE